MTIADPALPLRADDPPLDASDSDPSPERAEGPTARIAGLYDLTHELEGLEHVYYLEILTDGVFREYHYLGDAFAVERFGSALNCYDIDPGRLEPLEGNTYSWTQSGARTHTVTLVREGGVLSISGPVEAGAPFGLVRVSRPFTGISATDLNACV